jgi:hypothetical protein
MLLNTQSYCLKQRLDIAHLTYLIHFDISDCLAEAPLHGTVGDSKLSSLLGGGVSYYLFV